MTPNNQTGAVNLIIGIIVAIALTLGGGYYVYEKTGGDVSINLPPILSDKFAESPEVKPSENNPAPVACTLEAKICPDGTSVGRSGPNCEFAACPAVVWKTYRLGDGPLNLAGMGYTSFEIKYPSSWTYKEFSMNIEGVAFYPANMPDGGSIGGGMQINTPVILYPYSHDMTGAITNNSSTHHNFPDESEKIMASIDLLDSGYQKEFDEMIASFQFIN